MLEVDTFLCWLYVVVDDLCKALPPTRVRGPAAALSRSEVVTLALFGQWGRFATERDFYRYADRRLRGAFPALPTRTPLNRLIRAEYATIAACAHALAARLRPDPLPYEALDGTAVPVRNIKRRGRGWLAGQADIGWSSSVGWYEGFYLALSVTPTGVVTGWALAPASAKDQRVAESFFALRHAPDPRVPSVGPAPDAPYATDGGFEGRILHAHWRADYGATVVAPPQPRSDAAWGHDRLRWLAGLRQIVETVNDKLHHTFRLRRERPHHLSGLLARLAAKVALHNFCAWLNRRLRRPPLAFADLIAW